MGRRQNKVETVEDFLTEAVDNIRRDRATTNSLLADLVLELKKTPTAESHKDLGLIAAKYVETLQRSNEQLVKITSIINKKTDSLNKLSNSEKSDIYDLLQGEK